MHRYTGLAALAGGVGSIMSDYATTAPGAIAEFNVSVNQLHGSVDDCLTAEP